MSIGKPHALRGQLVDVRCGDLTTVWVVASDVAIPEIIGVDHHDVGPFCCLTGKNDRYENR